MDLPNRPDTSLSPLGALKRGTACIWLHKRLLLGLYAVNVLVAAVIILPFRSVVSEIGKSDLSENFIAGFDFNAWLDVSTKFAAPLKSVGLTAVMIGVLYLLVNVFLSGGIVATLAADERVSLRRFFYGASRYFWRYARLFVLLILVIGGIVAAYGGLLSDVIDDLKDAAKTDVASFLWSAAGVSVLLISFSLALMVFDYAKIRMVVDGRKSAFLAVLASLTFVVRRAFRTVPLFLLNLIIVVLLFAVYLVVENQFSNSTLNSMIGLLVVQQLFILSRIWMKLSFYSSQLAYYQSTGLAPRSSSPMEAPSPMDAPQPGMTPPMESPRTPTPLTQTPLGQPPPTDATPTPPADDEELPAQA